MDLSLPIAQVFYWPNLKRQTIYNANQPQVSCDVIANNLELDFNSENNADQDHDLSDDHGPCEFAARVVPTVARTSSITNGSLATDAISCEIENTNNVNSPSIVPDPPTCDEMNPHLSSEVELINICRQLKTPLTGFKMIWEWAMKCQQKRGFDFARLSNCRTRETVINDVKKHAHVTEMDEFEKTTLKWLPSNKSVQVQIRPFKKALYSLLTKTQLVVEENLSLPDSRNPYSYENYPPVDVISELHHGNWWKRTWANRCVES